MNFQFNFLLCKNLYFLKLIILGEMSLYTKCIPTTILLVPLLFLAYELFKVYKNNMDHPVRFYIPKYLYCPSISRLVNIALRCEIVKII